MGYKRPCPGTVGDRAAGVEILRQRRGGLGAGIPPRPIRARTSQANARRPPNGKIFASIDDEITTMLVSPPAGAPVRSLILPSPSRGKEAETPGLADSERRRPVDVARAGFSALPGRRETLVRIPTP